MARFRSHVFGTIRGKLGGLTFTGNPSRSNLVQTRRHTRTPVSNETVKVKTSLSACNQAFLHLSDEFRNKWIDFTGSNNPLPAFINYYHPHLMANKQIGVSVPGVLLPPPEPITNAKLSGGLVNAGGIGQHIDLVETWSGGTELLIIVQLSRPCSLSWSSCRSRWNPDTWQIRIIGTSVYFRFANQPKGFTYQVRYRVLSRFFNPYIYASGWTVLTIQH